MAILGHSLERTGMVAVEGGDIHYRYYEPHNAEATARTPLIYIHGGPGGSQINNYAALNQLADQRPVLFYDQLGSHFSPADMTPDLMRVDRFVDELDPLIETLGRGLRRPDSGAARRNPRYNPPLRGQRHDGQRRL